MSAVITVLRDELSFTDGCTVFSLGLVEPSVLTDKLFATDVCALVSFELLPVQPKRVKVNSAVIMTGIENKFIIFVPLN